MRIVYILAGAGGMYCGACNRDMELVNAIHERGSDIQIIPLYTPLRSDVISKLQPSRIFYGGIITFLQQKMKLFRHTPKFIDYLVDNATLLHILGKVTISTKPEKLGPLTVSVLAGENGNQKKELEKLITYLHSIKPDIINITNSMLSGIAIPLKKEFDVPVVCTLQGEEAFIASLPKPHNDIAKTLLRENANFIDMFISPHAKYTKEMSNFLNIPLEKITTICPAINIKKYSFQKKIPNQKQIKIGYLSRIAPEKGLDLLLEAFKILLKKRNDISLHIAGQIYDKNFWQMLEKKQTKIKSKVFYHGELNLKAKQQFLKECNVFCIPSQFNESRGMAALEAMASGVPIVLPKSGIYEQLIEDTGHGLLSENTPEEFAKNIERIIADDSSQEKFRGDNRDIFTKKYSLPRMVDEIMSLYKKLI